MAHTVLDIATDALAELGVIAAGDVPSDADAQLCLSGLNDLVDQYAAERLAIYTLTRTTIDIVVSTQTYTIGSGGDVAIARPVYIDHVNFVDAAPSPAIEFQLSELSEDAWSRVPQKALTATLPTSWYHDKEFPLDTLTFWPNPTSSTLTGVIYAPTAVAEFAALSTSVALPPGYRRMLIKSLAVEVASSFERQPSPSLIIAAAESRATVKRANKRQIDMTLEAAALIQGRHGRFTYNIITGP